jgi:hypothetical protein
MKKEDSLVKELKILKEMIVLVKANDKLGVISKFEELCDHQHSTMESEAYDATTEVIRNAQRYARCKVQFGNDEGDQGKPNQEDHQGKEH